MRDPLTRGTLRIFLLMLLAGGAATASANEAQALVDRVVEAYGGRDAVASVQALRETGTTFSNLRKTRGDVTRAYEHSGRLSIDIQYPGVHESRILDGESAWRHGRPSGGPFRLAMVLQAARIGLPRLLLENRETVIDRGTVETADGRQRVLELDLGNSMHLSAQIDPETGRILQSRGVMDMGGAAMEFAAAYSDFREVEGHLVAFKEVHFAMGRNTGYTELERVEFLDSLPDSLFRPGSSAEMSSRSPTAPL